MTKIYDTALYNYLYFSIWLDQKIDALVELVDRVRTHRENVRWIKKNGPYNGSDR